MSEIGIYTDRQEIMKSRQRRQLATWSRDTLKRVQNIIDLSSLSQIQGESLQKLEGILAQN